MADNYQCVYCKAIDDHVVEWTIWRQDWRGKVAAGIFYAHKECHLKETSTAGDGQGVRGVTA